MKLNGHICVIEDDQKIADVLCDYLHANSFQTSHFSNGLQALEALKVQPCDLILLDRLLPGLDGMTLCYTIRQFSHVPIIMLTALIDEGDKLDGLEAGADDYICKPFSPREVMARVKAQLRRSQLPFHTQLHETNLSSGTAYPVAPHAKFTLQEENLSILCMAQNLNLTPVEFRIFAELLKHPNRVYSRQQLLNIASEDYRESSDRTIDAHIKNIRKKITAINQSADCLHSVYGVGYRYEAL